MDIGTDLPQTGHSKSDKNLPQLGHRNVDPPENSPLFNFEYIVFSPHPEHVIPIRLGLNFAKHIGQIVSIISI